MTEELRQRFSLLIGLYVGKVLDGYSIDTVPEKIREVVREESQDKDKYVNIYVARVLKGTYQIESVPSTIREEVRELSQSVNGDVTVMAYIAWVLEGKKELEDIPEEVREQVKTEVEDLIGKKLD